jgi:hypothetical protein
VSPLPAFRRVVVSAVVGGVIIWPEREALTLASREGLQS